MKNFKIIYILIFMIFSLQSNAQTANFSVDDSTRISSFSVMVTANYSDSTEFYSFLWDFGDGNTSTEPIVEHLYSLAGDYTIRLTATLDSVSSTEWADTTITILDAFTIPNVFTPNNDGINDYFIVYSNGIRSIKIQIFNRSGVLVYKNTAPAIAWDGRNFSGVEVGPGVYYYIIVADGGVYERANFFHLFR